MDPYRVYRVALDREPESLDFDTPTDEREAPPSALGTLER